MSKTSPLDLAIGRYKLYLTQGAAKESLSILHPLASLEWSDHGLPTELCVPIDICADRVQAVYVPDNRNGKLYVANGSSGLCFSTVTSNLIKWDRHDLPLKIGSYVLAEFCLKLVLVGGFIENDTDTDKVWSLNSKVNKWEEMPPMPTKRSSAVAVGHGTYLVVAGGRKAAEHLMVVEVYDDHSKQWKTVQELPKQFSEGLTSALHDGIWYLMAKSKSPAKYREVYKTSIEDLISSSDETVASYLWESLDSRTSHPPSGSLSPVSFGGHLLCIGKKYSPDLQLYLYCKLKDAWISILENIPFVPCLSEVVCLAALSSRAELLLIYSDRTVKKLMLRGTYIIYGYPVLSC